MDADFHPNGDGLAALDPGEQGHEITHRHAEQVKGEGGCSHLAKEIGEIGAFFHDGSTDHKKKNEGRQNAHGFIHAGGQEPVFPADKHANGDGGEDDNKNLNNFIELERDDFSCAYKGFEGEVNDEREREEGKNAIDGGKGDIERNISFGEVREEIGGGAAWRGGEEHQADGEFGREAKAFGEGKAKGGQNKHLASETHEHCAGIDDNALEIGDGEAEAEAKHNDAQRNGEKDGGNGVGLHGDPQVEVVGRAKGE